MILLLLVIDCLTASAYDFKIDNIYYTKTSPNTVKVTRGDTDNETYYSYSGKVVIPEIVRSNGQIYNVTGIDDYAFQKCYNLTSVTIPLSVKNIGIQAFMKCNSLKSVDIPNSVTDIAEGAFAFCNSLTSANIGNSVTSIEYATFWECPKLRTVTIGESVKFIGEHAFYRCSSLESISIPNSVTSIENAAFLDCSSLNSVSIPNSVTTIGDVAFYLCTSLETMTIPNSVTSIGIKAFAFCKSMTTVTIPESVTFIGFYGFGDCISLKTVYSYSEEPPVCDSGYTFNYAPEDVVLHVPTGTKDKYAGAEGWSSIKNIVDDLGADQNSVDDIILQGSKSTTSKKVVRNGRIYILKDNKMYNMSGVEVK